MNFLGIGTGEILVILIIAVLVVGPERMVDFAREAGKMLATLRRMSQDVKSEFREAFDFDLDEVRQTFDLSDVRDALDLDPRKAKPTTGEEETTPVASAAAADAASQTAAPAASPGEPAVSPSATPTRTQPRATAQKPSSPSAADDEPVEVRGTQFVAEGQDAEAVKVNEVLVIQAEPVSEQAEPVSEQAEPVSEQAEPVSEQAEPVSEQAEPVSGDGLREPEESIP